MSKLIKYFIIVITIRYITGLQFSKYKMNIFSINEKLQTQL